MSQPEMPATRSLWSRNALTADGWQTDVLIEIDDSGQIASVESGVAATGERFELLLPAMPNLHSHAFQRAMAGMTETRGEDAEDSFWTWRKLMYRFLDSLTPDDVESIAAFAQLEMLESGYTSVGEFHYLHHQADGSPYAARAEMSERIVAAAESSSIGLTLLPVLYEQGGCDGRSVVGGQRRFRNNLDEFAELYAGAKTCIGSHASNANIGIAPHSLRAVSRESLTLALELAGGNPFHIHVAEQQAEVDELMSAYGARPVEWLLDNQPLDRSWCLIHATQMTSEETARFAASGSVAGLCPVTESNLGDGIFDGRNFMDANGIWGIGTDSNIRISLSEELRTLEYSQRLRDKQRVIFAEEQVSNGRLLYDAATLGGAQALQRNTGRIAVGMQADLLALDASSTSFLAVKDDNWLDAWLFANDDRLVTDVWANGAHVVKDGLHVKRNAIESRYRKTMQALVGKI